MISARGRGVKRGPVRIKVARIIPEQEVALKKQGNSGGVYEDVMLYVKDQRVATRGRGRPRKFLPDSQPLSNTTEVIYVPSLGQGKRQFMPIMTMNRMPHGIQVHGVPSLSRAQHQANVSRQVQLAALQQKKAALAVEAVRPRCEEQIDWPQDLKWLVSSWDHLPESGTRELVKWLHTPLNNPTQPSIVSNIHKLVGEWEDTEQNKIDQIGAWLLEEPPTRRPQPRVIPPKVVVEAEPVPLQNCGQWSSMADNQENLKP